MKILIYIATYERSNVMETILNRFQFPKEEQEIELVFAFVVSPEDKEYYKNVNIATKFLVDNDLHGYIIKAHNLPVGAKMNAGLEMLLGLNSFDYMMNFGSDDILSVRYWDVMLPLMKQQREIIMMSKLIVLDVPTLQAVEFELKMIGGGRLIRWDLIKATQESVGHIYVSNRNSGLDTCSFLTLNQETGAENYIVDDCLLLDIKTSVNITQFDKLIQNEHKQRRFSELKQEFGNLSEICAAITNS